MRSPNWSPVFLMPEDRHNAGFGIYVHWPFCQSKCPYCDFNSHVSNQVDQSQWAKAFVLEIERYRKQTPDRLVNSVFFGGGTPSLMSPALVETILTAISESWPVANDVEITLEANPTSVETQKFRDLQSAGVNRLSLGIQSLNDNDLKRLGRLHSASEAQRALDVARQVFQRVSFDLIYARQHQTLADWESELGLALSFGTEHMSLYQLTVESSTAFGRLHKAGKLLGLPKDDVSADMYALTQQMCNDAGLPAYEVSNHAVPGAESKHNLVYWRCGDFLGIGPGAHGRLAIGDKRFATEAEMMPDAWLSEALDLTGETVRDQLNTRDIALEYLLMSLRLSEGLDISRLNELDNSLLNNDKISELSALGLLNVDSDRLIATQKGRMVLNSVIQELANDC
ncbi:MAG: putative oxygen-independent coproporphyrinogen III oxidase [Paracoccaceae bacterium]|jgi:putative oxygen-independent coproporphyrinogen III oxidase